MSSLSTAEALHHRSTWRPPKINKWSSSPFLYQGKGMSQPFTPGSAFLRRKCFHRQCLWRGSLNQESGWFKGQDFTTATNRSLLSTQPSSPSCDDCPFLHRTNPNQQFYLHWQLFLWFQWPQFLSEAFQRLLHNFSIFSTTGQGIRGSGMEVTDKLWPALSSSWTGTVHKFLSFL